MNALTVRHGLFKNWLFYPVITTLMFIVKRFKKVNRFFFKHVHKFGVFNPFATVETIIYCVRHILFLRFTIKYYFNDSLFSY